MGRRVVRRNTLHTRAWCTKIVLGTLLYWIVPTRLLDSSQQDRLQTLESALVPGCKITMESTGRVDDIRAWLDCGCGGVLVLQPMNLLRRVRIRSSEQALSFVRLFSSKETYRYFAGPNRVEILPAQEDGPFILARQKFDSVATPLKVEQDADASGRLTFRITRTTVSLSNLALEEIVELVHEDGYYTLVSTRVLAEDATKLGIGFI